LFIVSTLGERNGTDVKTNLPHTVTEDSLGKFFAKYGPIGTLKIMWRMYTSRIIADCQPVDRI
jgi:RNA recognition motif-containing protein